VWFELYLMARFALATKMAHRGLMVD